MPKEKGTQARVPEVPETRAEMQGVLLEWARLSVEVGREDFRNREIYVTKGTVLQLGRMGEGNWTIGRGSSLGGRIGGRRLIVMTAGIQRRGGQSQRDVFITSGSRVYLRGIETSTSWERECPKRRKTAVAP